MFAGHLPGYLRLQRSEFKVANRIALDDKSCGPGTEIADAVEEKHVVHFIAQKHEECSVSSRAEAKAETFFACGRGGVAIRTGMGRKKPSLDGVLRGS